MMLVAEIKIKIYMDESEVPDSPEHPLFDTLDSLEGDLAGVVVSSLYEYKTVCVKIGD